MNESKYDNIFKLLYDAFLMYRIKYHEKKYMKLVSKFLGKKVVKISKLDYEDEVQ